jgi:uncharacterized protein YkwD
MNRRSLAALAGAAFVVPSLAWAGERERAVFDALNSVRGRPADWAVDLRDEGATDDPAALEEAIDFLRRARPLAPLKFNPGLAAAAQDHVDSQGPRGEVGHAGRDGATLSTRLQRRGVWAGTMGEDISYGYAQPDAIIRQLIIDSGVPGRGHRQNIFDAGFSAAGVGCGPHRLYGFMCVIDFAGALVVR